MAKTPGVYIQELHLNPSQISAVETSIPAFIGITQKAGHTGESRLHVPSRITSLTEYEQLFGTAPTGKVTLFLNARNQVVNATPDEPYCLYDSLRLYFDNGGGPCYIVSVGTYTQPVTPEAFEEALVRLETCDEPSIVAAPDAVTCLPDPTAFQRKALEHCANRHDRVFLCDIRKSLTFSEFSAAVDEFRQEIGTDFLSFGAAYGPWLLTSLSHQVVSRHISLRRFSDQSEITLESLTDDPDVLALISALRTEEMNTTEISHTERGLNARLANSFPLFRDFMVKAAEALSILPPCGAIAGVYATVDRQRGVWKAPANISLNTVVRPVIQLNAARQEQFNIDPSTGKSINIIRSFTGKGTLVWGARTLAGNDPEWRYISVRRFCIFVEESIRKGTEWVVFEPNDAATWERLRNQTGSFLNLLWRQGAMAGVKPEEAFYVKAGLGTTMTALDILEGRVIVEVGLAVIRPAEFIIIRFSHKMVGES